MISISTPLTAAAHGVPLRLRTSALANLQSGESSEGEREDKTLSKESERERERERGRLGERTSHNTHTNSCFLYLLCWFECTTPLSPILTVESLTTIFSLSRCGFCV